MDTPVLLFGKSWPNSLSERGGAEENSISFTLHQDRICFGFGILFDANEYDWDRGVANFDKGSFVKCMRDFKELGEAKISTPGSYVSFRKDGPVVYVSGNCGGIGIMHEAIEIPESAFRKLGIA